MKDLADAAIQWDGPLLAAIRVPVHRHDGGAGEIQATFEVVIDEGLDQSVVVGAPGLVAGQRPDVVDQRTVNPGVAVFEVQEYEGRTQPPIFVSQFRVAVSRNLNDRTR